MTKILVIQDDITKMIVDAIVNAGRPSLLGGGGVDGAIHRGAGSALKFACEQLPEKEPGVRCYTGEAFLTAGYNLPARYVIHTVGPLFADIEIDNAITLPDGTDKEKLLYEAYLNSLKLADATQCKTIAFPAISCGVYGCPLELGVNIAYKAATSRKWDHIEEISLVMFTDEELETAKIVINSKIDRYLAVRRMLLPRDTNHRGEVFGGAVLAEIDLAGAMEAQRHTNHDVATIAMDGIEFKKPLKIGDAISFWTSLVKIGKTSITVRVEVTASRPGREDDEKYVTAANLVYVAIKRDADGNIIKVPVK